MIPDRSFFSRDALEVAPELLNSLLTTRIPDGEVTVRVTEVEAYHGLGTGDLHDPGSHARMGMTARNQTMFGPPGHLYVYFTYGMHSSANVVCSPEGTASGILLRAGEIVDGIDIARARRPACRRDVDLARGPGRFAKAMGLLHPIHDGVDAVTAGGVAELSLAEAGNVGVVAGSAAISSGPRVGVSGEGGTDGFPWRFWLTGDPSVSQYRAAKRSTARS